MDLKFSAEDEAYRQRLRAWLEENTGPQGSASALMKLTEGTSAADRTRPSRNR